VFTGDEIYLDAGEVDYETVQAVSIAIWFRNLGGASSQGALLSHRRRSGERLFGGHELSLVRGEVTWWLVDPVRGLNPQEGDTGETPVSFTLPMDDRWYHAAATWSASSGTARLYLDGELRGTAEHLVDNLGTGPWNLKFGASDINSEELDAQLDEIRIWDRELSSQEIREVYSVLAPLAAK
jgi:hypothetical protein